MHIHTSNCKQECEYITMNNFNKTYILTDVSVKHLQIILIIFTLYHNIPP